MSTCAPPARKFCGGRAWGMWGSRAGQGPDRDWNRARPGIGTRVHCACPFLHPWSHCPAPEAPAKPHPPPALQCPWLPPHTALSPRLSPGLSPGLGPGPSLTTPGGAQKRAILGCPSGTGGTETTGPLSTLCIIPKKFLVKPGSSSRSMPWHQVPEGGMWPPFVFTRQGWDAGASCALPAPCLTTAFESSAIQHHVPHCPDHSAAGLTWFHTALHHFQRQP